MRKTKIKLISFKFLGKVIENGVILDFKAKKIDNTDFKLSNIKGNKIISVFPDINTSICDKQTQKISQLSIKFPKVKFISVSMDSIEKQNDWCAAHNIENILIVSDKEYKDFGKKTNLYIPKIKKLGRALMILNDDNEIIDLSINEEVAAEPNWELIEKYLEKTNK